ncbi:hypothetical protein GCM10022225_25230 [Plantactinospora mayteni]|uniref:Uncharacterized protein n=1 Tax=Plantactinospora mayteni TaxID=566021 RepID=A0ABQ4EJ32_9ACTN|nr:hypothetical protein [Plantactinospora mayteni]GIG94747.1 hypothetical protein Pma05_13200 [Plantactinospora mayteni]
MLVEEGGEIRLQQADDRSGSTVPIEPSTRPGGSLRMLPDGKAAYTYGTHLGPNFTAALSKR